MFDRKTRVQMKTPTQMLSEGLGRISRPAKCTFISALLAGLAAHLYQYTNKIYNYDDLFTNPEGYGTGAESGRWFLQFMGEWMNDFLGNYSLPLVNGLLTLLFLAVSALLITELFEVKDMLLASLIGIFFVTIPTVVCMNFFMYTVAYYGIALFLSVLAAYLIVRHPRNILLQLVAAGLLACAIGTYQAYFANAVCILVLDVILTSAFSGEEKRASDIVRTSVRYVVLLVLALVIYFIGNKLSLAYWDVELGSYQGIDSMGQISLKEIPGMLYQCYFSFLWFCRNDIFQENPTAIVKGGIFVMYVISAALTAYVLFRKKSTYGKKILLLLSLAAYPVAVFLIYIMVPHGWIYTLMTFSVVFIYLFVFIWLDRCRFHLEAVRERAGGVLMHWGVSVAALVIAVIYIWYANGNYMSLQYTQYHDLAYFETLVTQLKSAEGYEDGLPLAVVGNEFVDSSHTTGSLMGAEFNLPGKNESNINAYSRWQIVIKYLGYNPQFLWRNEVKEIEKMPEVKAMPSYPADGSIQVIEDVLVLKLSEPTE